MRCGRRGPGRPSDPFRKCSFPAVPRVTQRDHRMAALNASEQQPLAVARARGVEREEGRSGPLHDLRMNLLLGGPASVPFARPTARDRFQART